MAKKRPWWKVALHKIVLLRPILKILGVKDKTAVAKGAAVAEVVDKATDPEAGGVVLVIVILILMFTVVYAALPPS